MVLCGDNQESISCASRDGCLHFHTQSTARNFTKTSPAGFLQTCRNLLKSSERRRQLVLCGTIKSPFPLLRPRLRMICLDFHIPPTLNLAPETSQTSHSGFCTFADFTFLHLHFFAFCTFISFHTQPHFNPVSYLNKLDFAKDFIIKINAGQ